jgi:hypothetical protein
MAKRTGNKKPHDRYTKSGVNPFTKSSFVLFDWTALDSAARGPRSLAASAYAVAFGGSAVGVGRWRDAEAIRTEDERVKLLEFVAGEFPAKLSSDVGVVGLVVPWSEDRVQAGHCALALQRDWEITDRFHPIVRTAEDCDIRIGGPGAWHQVDEHVESYFVSGAYERDPTAVQSILSAGLDRGALRRAYKEGAAIGPALEAAGTEPETLVGRVEDWVVVMEIDGERTEVLSFNARLYVMALRDDLEGKTAGNTIDAWSVLQLS